MNVYNMELNEDKGGLFAISLVDQPAIESDFMLLSKDLKLCLLDEKRKNIMGAVLIPNIPIFRANNGDPFYAQFNEETIIECAKSFLNRKDKTFSIQHNGEAIEANIVESFIANEDMTSIYAPKGSWVVKLEIEDKDALQKVYSKMINGFSIEGVFKKGELINLKSDVMNEAKIQELIDKVQALLDAIAASSTPIEETPAEESVTTEMKKEIEELKIALEAEKAAKQILEDAANESVLKMQQEVSVSGFRGFINKLNK